ncbi:DUF4112 domain-containing protein [Marinobacter sp. SS21]|uniref:DUF4112 domain-containing protein n=1 Tax=Marinobacter sp. SS21 TaxID=2979460 RepID=UPI00232C1575|nr:DUF4112 domain-containing protein [Marinobacter sp. SS21]MDC0661598.1 DUF4112 domain-containing protein [Marinobacter sp. SS21]
MTKVSDTSSTGNESERYQQALARLDRYARTLDSQFRVPFTRIRFGFDPLIGLVPVVGDVIGLLLSLYLVVEAIRLGAGPGLVMKMLGNLLAEFVIGLVPVLGDAFDVMWRANDRNAALLRGYIQRKLHPRKPSRPWLSYILMGGFAALMLLLLGLVVYSLLAPTVEQALATH